MSVLTYTYKGETYSLESSLRNAIFASEGLVFGECTDPYEWSQVGVEVQEHDSLPISEETLAKQVRSKRDTLLFRSDYYVMPDYPSTEEGLKLMKAYRQQLRDITKQPEFPYNVTWPENPLPDGERYAE